MTQFNVIDVPIRVNMDSHAFIYGMFTKQIKWVCLSKIPRYCQLELNSLLKPNGQDHSALGLYLLSVLLEEQKIGFDCDEKRMVVPLGKSRTTHLELGWKCSAF